MPANTSMQGTYIPQYTQVPQSNVSVEVRNVLLHSHFTDGSMTNWSSSPLQYINRNLPSYNRLPWRRPQNTQTTPTSTASEEETLVGLLESVSWATCRPYSSAHSDSGQYTPDRRRNTDQTVTLKTKGYFQIRGYGKLLDTWNIYFDNRTWLFCWRKRKTHHTHTLFSVHVLTNDFSHYSGENENQQYKLHHHVSF